jgi:hypothetical protein
VHVVRFVSAGLLAFHNQASPAASANAILPISATVSSVCAISSRPLRGGGRQASAEAPGLARVRCSPTAAYAISFDPRARDIGAVRRVDARASAPSGQPAGRRNDVLVVEISY